MYKIEDRSVLFILDISLGVCTLVLPYSCHTLLNSFLWGMGVVGSWEFRGRFTKVADFELESVIAP